MTEYSNPWLRRCAIGLVALMALLQGAYALYAYADPQGFSALRGTELFAAADADWVQIYASRTLFVSLVVGFLLVRRAWQLLFWVALFGVVMPVTDAWLAWKAQAATAVVGKHVATAVYLLLTAGVLWRLRLPGAARGER